VKRPEWQLVALLVLSVIWVGLVIWALYLTQP
jgi:hypothetical protein